MKFIFFTLCSLSLLFANVTIGDPSPIVDTVDQFGEKVEIASDATLVISFQKSVSSEIQTYLASKPKQFLTKNHISYVSDMSAAPSFMIKLFAIPKMKKFTYKVSLIYDNKMADNIQRKLDKATVITLRHHKIIKIQFVSPKDLNKILDN